MKIYECSAVACGINDTERQPALFCVYLDDKFHDSDFVLFDGYKIDDFEKNNFISSELYENCDSCDEAIKSIFIDGQPLKYWKDNGTIY